jgi:hypothetical protein
MVVARRRDFSLFWEIRSKIFWPVMSCLLVADIRGLSASSEVTSLMFLDLRKREKVEFQHNLEAESRKLLL